MALQGDNDRITYRTARDNKFLKSFVLEVQKDEAPILVPDPAQSDVAWKISGPRTRFVGHQVVACRFTDPDSYASNERKPATSFTAMTAAAQSWSLVDLPGVMGTQSNSYRRFSTAATANMGNWNVTQHTCKRIADGAWEVEVTMIAFSDFIWDRNAISKTRVAAASTYQDSPTA